MKKDKKEIDWRSECKVVFYSDCSGRRDIYLTRKAYNKLKAMAKESGINVDQFIRGKAQEICHLYSNELANAAIALCRKKRVMKPEWVLEKIKTVTAGTPLAA